MIKSAPKLKLYAEEHPDESRPVVAEIVELGKLKRVFEQATGWRLHWEQHEAGSPLAVSSSIQLDHDLGVRPTTPQVAQGLAESITDLTNKLQGTREQLWRAEAELAACVPVGVRHDGDQHLADRLEAVLRGACESVGGNAAALYLLEDSSTEIKMRSCWGMSRTRLMEPARSLEGSLAELEALLGHAVVIEDAELLPTWPIPEDFPAGACVPIASDTTLLGVLWVFSESLRDFNDHQTGMLEIAAGRIASDLERTAVMREAVDSKQVSSALNQAVAWRRNRMPNIEPMLDDWQVAAWTSAGDGLNGDWYDWSILADGRLAVALCDAEGDQIEAALNATAMHSAYRAHAAHRHQPAELLKQVNETLWSSSTGGDGGSLAYAAIGTESGEFSLATSGAVCALQIRDRAHRTLRGSATPLGFDADLEVLSQDREMARGDLLVMISSGILAARDAEGNPITSSAVARAVRSADGNPEKAIRSIRHLLDSRFPYGGANDRSILVVRRR